jgi:hypothetical protein
MATVPSRKKIVDSIANTLITCAHTCVHTHARTLNSVTIFVHITTASAIVA